MSSTSKRLKVSVAVALIAAMCSCDEQKKEPSAPAVTAAVPVATLTAAAAVSSAPSATGPKPSHACPDGSKGEGTFDAPCLADKKDARMMEVKWTGKTSDKGPSFQVINKSDLEILYGQVVVYFYDKAGKQLNLPTTDPSAKAKNRQKCSGNIFAGPMKPKEKAVLWFSCVPKDHVPDGTATVEGEMQMVGFTGDNGSRADTYWRNEALAPDQRPKGGAK
ncbi:MAG: hypothetical protein MUF54_10375 [Polyangiaceae bacterium]|nr:hypothetical protein [Polyangiaceae bacterium]